MIESAAALTADDLEREKAEAVIRKLAIVAILAVVLGIVIQGAIVLVKIAAARGVTGASVILDFTQGVTWALLVCSGVSLGTSIMKARPMLAGLMALVFAPIAIALAKSSQKLVGGLMGAVEQEAALSLSTISILRAVEYGLLAWLLGLLVQRGENRLNRYLSAGVLAGIIFGSIICYLGYQAALEKGLPAGLTTIVASAINEILFPIGCSFVIYTGQMIGRSARLINR